MCYTTAIYTHHVTTNVTSGSKPLDQFMQTQNGYVFYCTVSAAGSYFTGLMEMS
uniref:Uncharacterized protein n=1 Tax=Anguilla anguilla TaxID=7936 RepID=A0A0E9WVE8_ANGAN